MNELAIIASSAESHGIPFLLGGGHAVITHGFPRSTFDLDLDVIRLLQNNKIDPEAREVRELFQKHGTPEFYEKARNACRTG